MADSDSDPFQSADEGDTQPSNEKKNKSTEGSTTPEGSQASGTKKTESVTNTQKPKSKNKKGRNKRGKKKSDGVPELKAQEATKEVESAKKESEEQDNEQNEGVANEEEERTLDVGDDQKEEQVEAEPAKVEEEVDVEVDGTLDEQIASAESQGTPEVNTEPELDAPGSSVQQDTEVTQDVESRENAENETEAIMENETNETVEKVQPVAPCKEPVENAGDSGNKDASDKVRTETGEPEAPDEQTIQGEREAPEEEHTIHGALDRLAAGGGKQKSGGQEEGGKPSGGGGGGWGWGGWGSSLISTATSKVSAVGHGLSSVIENVESSLGVPTPDEIIQQDATEKVIITSDGQQAIAAEKDEETVTKKEDGQAEEENAQPSQDKPGDQPRSGTGDQPAQSPSYIGGWFSYGATALTSAVEKTVTGGLDALELIGKKTMDVLQEGDPGFRRKRAYISEKTGQSINLSQMIREAKETAETASLQEEEQKEKEKFHFGILFDNYQGLAHLEALEMLANQSEVKVHSSMATLSGDKRSAVQTELTEIKDAFELEDLESDEIDDEIDEHDFPNLITEHLFGVCVAATPNKLHKVQKDAHEWLTECQKAQEEGEKKDALDLHIKAIETLAELTARSIEQFHKSAELMLLHQDKDQHKSLIQRATSLSKLTSTLCAELSSLSGKFCENLNTIANDETTEDASETINPIITNIYLEASNSASYIQDAFQLLLPVLQALAVENSMEETKPDSASAS